MAAFLVMALIKNFLSCFVLKWKYGKKEKGCIIKNPETNSRKKPPVKNPVLRNVWSHLGEETISYVFEDFVEVGIQFFCFEKYEFLPIDVFVIINLVFMMLKAIIVIFTIINYMRKKWKLKEIFRLNNFQIILN